MPEDTGFTPLDSEHQTGFIKFTPVKDYIKSKFSMQSTKDAVEEFISRFNSLTATVLERAAKLSQEDKRKTIMLPDIQTALEKTVGKKYLSWEDVLASTLRQNPTDLGKISKGIVDYIKKHEKLSIQEISTSISREFNLPKLDSEKIVAFILSKLTK